MEHRRRLPLLNPPPRNVPLTVRLLALFGGFHNQFGWAFLGFGLAGFWLFALNADLSGFLFALGGDHTVNGVVTQTRLTGASEGGGSESETIPIYEVSYVYLAQGRALQGVSYARGYAPDRGQQVTVEYLEWDPSVSRIRGMRRGLFGPEVLFVVIFPTIGAGFLMRGIGQGIQANQLLTRGRLALATLKSSQPTNTRINRRVVMALTFEYRAHDGGTYQVVARSHQPEAMQDETEEPVLYDLNEPTYAVMLDNIPGSPRFDEAGNFVPAARWAALKVVILPALTLLGNGAYLLLR